jgi:16S rRNA (cytosine967-C5)-methyltransferase
MRVDGGAFSSRLLAGGAPPGVRSRVMETLRWQGAADALLQERLRRRLSALDPEVRATLRLGLVEVMRLEVPRAVATDSAVRLVRRLGKSSAAGMVNAVLRAAAASWRDDLARRPLHERLAHPEWLVGRWSGQYGHEATSAALQSAQERAMTWAWFTDDSTRSDLVRAGVDFQPHPWCPGCWRSASGASELIAAAQAGSAYIQDPSSQLVARAAASLAPNAQAFLDVCAAPGGKSALLAKLVGPPLAVAADRSLQRLHLMHTGKTTASVAKLVVADGGRPPFIERAWHLVVLDAPCTGTGTFRRHPELKWRLRPEAVQEMAEVQRRLLDASLPLVAPDGLLLYTTCSIEPEENEGVVADLTDGFTVEKIGGAMPHGTPWIPTPAGGVRVLPHADGDGFTMHAVRRVV